MLTKPVRNINIGTCKSKTHPLHADDHSAEHGRSHWIAENEGRLARGVELEVHLRNVTPNKQKE